MGTYIKYVSSILSQSYEKTLDYRHKDTEKQNRYAFFHSTIVIDNLWVLAAHTRLCAVRTCLFGLFAKPNGGLSAPLPIAASLLPPK
jgi:hypothetical protein